MIFYDFLLLFIIHIGEEVNYTEYKDPHLVANLLKLYLRDLPDPLFTFKLYPQFIDAASMLRTKDFYFYLCF